MQDFPTPASKTDLPEAVAQPSAQLADSVSQPAYLTEDADRAHAQHIRGLALVLFDYTQVLHKLGDDSRHVLEAAAFVHDLPLPVGRKKLCRKASEQVRQYFAQELSPDEQKVLQAVLCCYHGKITGGKAGCKKIFSQLELSPIQQRETLTIVALLQIAIGLDHSGSAATTIQNVEPARDEVWIVVDGPQAQVDASMAQQNARLWVKIGYPAVRVMDTSEAAIKLLPLPEPFELVGIEPKDSLAEAGRKVMRYQFAQMLSHEHGTRLGEDIEALHDMRVATRRLRAAFDVFGQAFEPKALKPHLQGLRATGRALGVVRDLDVFMEKAQQYMANLPENGCASMQPLLQNWETQRQQARIQMLVHLKSPEYLTFKRQFNIFLNSPGAGARPLAAPDVFSNDIPQPSQVRELAPVLIYTRLAAVRAFDPFLANASIERLHALRIEFKKLRYTVEYFREVLGGEAQAVINDLKKIQDHLGDLHDAQVAAQILREFIDTWEQQQVNLPIYGRQNLEGVVSYMASRHTERHRLMITFQDVWAEFNQSEFRRNLAQAVAEL